MISARYTSVLRSRHLMIATNDEAISVTYQPPLTLTLGSVTRSRAVRNRVKATLKTAAPLSRTDDGKTIRAQFDVASAPQLKIVIAKIDRLLDRFAKERLTPRMVEEILGISAAERLRWSKDERLPKSGTGSFRQGKQSIHFNLHPPDKIAELAADRSVIAKWREQDAAMFQQRKLEGSHARKSRPDGGSRS